MRKLQIVKTMLLAAMMVGGVSSTKAACSVTTDSYGKTKVVWDFKIEAKDAPGSGNSATYYLDAKANAYDTESSHYGSATSYPFISKITIKDTRAITTTNGVGLGYNQGIIEFYAPFTGTLNLTGTWLQNITLEDKDAGTTTTEKATDSPNTGSGNTSFSYNMSIIQGRRYQMYASSGCTVATMTLTPADYGTDVVSDGSWDFSSLPIYYTNQQIVDADNFYQITNKGFKTAASNNDPKDALIVKGKAADLLILKPKNESVGMKLRYSNSSSYGEMNYTTSKAGWMTVEFNYVNGNWYFKDGSSNNADIAVTKTNSNLTHTFFLPANYRAQFVPASGHASVKKVTFTESVPVTMGTYGYTTFASQYPLDLSSLPSGLKAYYVEESGISKTTNKVTMTEATTTVAAGTGLMLKGTANETYQIPVAASGTNLSGTNKLIGCTSNTNITSSTTNYENFYVLVNTETQAELQNISSYVSGGNTVTIPVGKAYLDATGVSTARLAIAFEDETTGLNDVRDEPLDGRSDYYNLAGQRLRVGASAGMRVVKPAKGLYVKNGKKFIIK